MALLCAWRAEAQIVRGAVAGTVRDATGAMVAGATITVANADTNISRSAVTDEVGFFRIAAVEPGRYSLRVAKAGFATVEHKDIVVRTGTEVTVNPELKAAGAAESLMVIGEAEGAQLNKTDPTIGLTSTARQVAELPLSAAREINTLIGFAPNVVVTTDFSGATGGEGTCAVNGQRTRNNNYMVDGGDNNDITVTLPMSQVLPEAVAEFQVLTNAYSAEYGRSSGGQINVSTKSGTNGLKGELWDYHRNSKLFSLTNLDKASGLTELPKFTRDQLGAGLGGPIVRDKTFFFLVYQYDAERPEVSTGETVTTLTPAGYASLSNVPLRPGQTAPSRQAVLDRLSFLEQVYAQNPTFREVSTTLVNGVPIETGDINLDIKDPHTYHSFMGRLDHRLGANDSLTARYHYNRYKDDNVLSNCAFGTIFCGDADSKDSSLAVSHAHIFSSALLGETRLSWMGSDLKFPEHDPKSPTAIIGGLFTIGGLSAFPQSRATDSFQLSEMVTWTKARHTLKLGADVRHYRVDNESAFDSKGTFIFDSLQDYINNQASSFAQAQQTAGWFATQWHLGFFIQDDFRMTPDLTLNAGLRYETASVPLGMLGATDPESRAVGVPGPARRDTNNFAPRVGFAWSPRSKSRLLGDGKSVVRGGFGMGYDVVFYNLLAISGSNYPRVVVPRLFDVLDVYPNLLPASGSAVFNPLAGYRNSPEDLQSPDAKFWSLSAAREMRDFVVEVGYAGSTAGHGINQVEMNPAVLTAAQAAQVAADKSSAGIPAPQARRLHPEWGLRIAIPAYGGPAGNDVEARSTYHAGYVSVAKRLSHGLQFRAHYTVSRWMSNNDYALGEAGTVNGTHQRPQSMFDYNAEWSRSQLDRPHRVALDYIWEIPGPKAGALKQVLGGWQVAGTTVLQSGRPFTIVTGVDSNGDTLGGSDRPNVDTRGSFQWDESHRSFTNDGYYTAPRGTNGLPLANSLGNGTAPRNSERGARHRNTDLSLSKRFFMGKRYLTVRADVFNVFNEDSYGTPTNNMSSPSFGINENNWGQRTVTLGVKLTW